MALSKERLEKELAAQKYRAEKLEKEALAQKKKAEAIAHLESQGQRVEGVAGFSKKLPPKSSDNTLALLLGRKAVTTATEGEKIKEHDAKAALIKQQEDSRRSRELKVANESLPPSWESVFDNQSKSYYYWNRITNETSWQKPEVSLDETTENVIEKSGIEPEVIVTNNHPGVNLATEGWEEKVHPATQQCYYLNLKTGERRSVKPTLESLLPPNSSTTSQDATSDPSTTKRQSNGFSSADQSKFQRFAIDPLDYEAVQGNNRGGRTTDKMADSTASGPLWQQRPYPAPGTIMRAKEASSDISVGPSRGPSSSTQSYPSSSGQTTARVPYVRGSNPNRGNTANKGAPGHYGPSR